MISRYFRTLCNLTGLMGCLTLIVISGLAQASDVWTGVTTLRPSSPSVVSPAAAKAATIAQPRATARSPKSVSKSAVKPSGAAPLATPRSDISAMSAQLRRQTWFLRNRNPEGHVWERGVSGQTLARKRTVGRVNTQHAIDAALQDISSYERTAPSPEPSRVRGGVNTQATTWRNPVTEPVRVDQSTPVSKRSILGAYADVVHRDHLRVAVGPELSIENESSSNRRISHHANDSNALGVGMQFHWDF